MKNHRPMIAGLALAGLAAGFLSGCGEEATETPEAIRAIKWMEVSQIASGRSRRFSGRLQAADSSPLSFQVGGNVLEVHVNVGDQVRKGQLLAHLDRTEFELDVSAATADAARARADLNEKQLQYERQKQLIEKGWISQAALDQSEAAYLSAKSAVDFATSRLGQARSQLDKTELSAPFDGTVARRIVEPFMEVAPGQWLFEINAAGALEVAIDVPEGEITSVVMGAPAAVVVAVDGSPLNGRVTEISKAAGAGNTFPVKVTVLETNEGLRPGMTAEVILVLRGGPEGSGYLVPLSAIAPGEEAQNGYVFVYDPATGTLERRTISGQGVVDNMVIVTSGLAAGDIVATAGVSFLSHGQRVKLYEPKAASAALE